MQIIIQPSSLSGNIFAPASKSSMQRACAAGLVRKGITFIYNPGISNDDKAALGMLKALGAKVEELSNGSLKITSDGVRPVSDTVNCGESGLGIRMFTPIIALSEQEIEIRGEGSLLQRPMDFFDEVLPQLNVSITSDNGKLPLKIKGPLQPKNITIDGSLSSQFLTGLLFAFAASIRNIARTNNEISVRIKVRNLKSKPYIDLTLDVMRQFGLLVPVNNNYEEFVFYFNAADGLSEYGEVPYTVEGDWSGGSFLLVAGAIAGDITVQGLNIHSTQADKAVLNALKDCGCKLVIEEKEIKIGTAANKERLKAFHFDATDCPDLFPPLTALAAYCNGTSVIEGVHRLTHKESNRALTLQEELGKMGVKIELEDNKMLIKGGAVVKGANVHSRHDHRIAMACAVTALKANGETVIEGAEAVKKSYPDFYQHIQKLGAAVKKDSVNFTV